MLKMKIVKNEKQNIYGMARAGYIDNLEIYVNTNDGGNIPHFHIRNTKEWNKFHTCIKIETAEYFHHTGKEDILNSKQRKELANFMKSNVQIDRYRNNFTNNYELICFLWDINNSTAMIDDNTVMPDYTKLK